MGFMTTISSSRYVVIGCLCALLLVACSTVSNLGQLLLPDVQLQTVTLEASKDVNGGYPVALDVLLLTDQKVYDALGNLRATEWFAGKADYLRQHQNKLFLTSWELVPGQRLEGVSLTVPPQAVIGTLIFADYLGDRTYRASVVKKRAVVIQLNRDDFELLPYDSEPTTKTK